MIAKIGTQTYPISLAVSAHPDIEQIPPERTKFYQGLSEEIQRRLGLGVYFPARDLPQGISSGQVYSTVSEKMLESKLFIADIGTPSTDAGIILGIGLGHGKPFVTFYHEGDREDQILKSNGIKFSEAVRVCTPEQGVQEIVEAVRKHF